MRSAASVKEGSKLPFSASQHHVGSAQMASTRTAQTGHWSEVVLPRRNIPNADIHARLTTSNFPVGKAW